MAVMRQSAVSGLCIVLLLCAGQAFCHENATQQSLQFELLYRLAHDLGSVMADVKTVLMYQSQNYRDLLDAITEMKAMQSQTLTKMDAISTQLSTQQDKKDIKGLCAENATGFVTILLQETPVSVTCDGKGWIVLMRRVDGNYNFPERTWGDYKLGFGNPLKSFWLGLEHIHQLTSLGQARLRVELQDFEDEESFAEYSYFHIEGEEQGYRLMVDGYSGTAGDSLAWHNGMKFSTLHRDNDYDTRNCAKYRQGAWWHKSCGVSNLNAVYKSDGTVYSSASICWYHWKGYYPLKKVTMKMLVEV